MQFGSGEPHDAMGGSRGGERGNLGKSRRRGFGGLGPAAQSRWNRYDSAKVSMVGAIGGIASTLFEVTNRQFT